MHGRRQRKAGGGRGSPPPLPPGKLSLFSVYTLLAIKLVFEELSSKNEEFERKLNPFARTKKLSMTFVVAVLCSPAQ